MITRAQNKPTKPWHRACSRCGKETFEDLLDADGRCDYCREVAAMKTSSRKVHRQRDGQGFSR